MEAKCIDAANERVNSYYSVLGRTPGSTDCSLTCSTPLNENRRIDKGCILYTNARSLLNKLDELQHLILSSRPLIVGLTETWLHAEIADEEIKIDGYFILRNDRHVGMCGGGVCLYVREDLSATELFTSVDISGHTSKRHHHAFLHGDHFEE